MSKNILVVVVYDRFYNLERWIKCWEQCDKNYVELRILHNYKNQEDLNKYKKYCQDNNITYISRSNSGYDIGAFKQVCQETLEGFKNNWDNMLWVADDTYPMSKDFTNLFFSKLEENPKIGVTCLEMSKEYKLHIRTTGFCIKKEVAKKLIFDIQIITKLHCYLFEHRSPNSFLEQVIKMGYQSLQLSNIQTAKLWDTGHRANLKRMKEHNSVFFPNLVNNDKITFIAPIYNTYPQIVGSLINQTHQNWQLLLIHDGQNSTKLSKIIESIGDNRIKFIETSERQQQWGHPIRKWALENIENLSPNTNYISITNGDNTVVPHFCEYMLKPFENKEVVATYCSQFVHAYDSWQKTSIFVENQRSANNIEWKVYKYGVIDTRLRLGYIDSACVVMRKEYSVESGWEDMTHSSDWSYFFRIISKYGQDKWHKVDGCLLNHN